MKKTLTSILTAIMLLSLSIPAWAADPSARTISIFKTEGSQVTMTKGTAREFAAKTGLKLFDGYTVATGGQSYCYLQMDADTLTKMNEKSAIEVNKLSDKKLSVAVLSGGIAVNAAQQKDGDILEIRAGNSALAIRGTIFTAEYVETEEFAAGEFMDGEYEFIFVITVLEGEVEVDGNLIQAGQTMYVYDKIVTRVYEIRETVIDETMTLFTLETIWENRDAIIKAGTFTEEDIAKIPDLIEEKKKNQQQEQDNITVTDDIHYYEEETTGGGGGGGTPAPATGNASLYLGGSSTPIPKTSVVVAYQDAQNAGAAGIGSTITVTGNGSIGAGQTIDVGGGSNVSSLTVSAGASLTISGPGSALNVSAGGTITNNGTIINDSNTINLDNGSLNNYDTLENTANGRILLQGYAGSLLNQGTITNYGIIDSQGGASGAVFTNMGQFTNEGLAAVFSNDAIFRNFGNFINQNSAELVNIFAFNNEGGSFTNQTSGAVANSAGASITNLDGGTFNNSASVSNDYGGYFFNTGMGSVFNNQGTGTFDNNGDFDNKLAGEFNNDAVFTNHPGGTINNSDAGTAYSNQGTMENNGLFYNLNSAGFTNSLLFTNQNAATIMTGGLGTVFDNQGTLDNSGELYNQDYSWFTNSAVFNNQAAGTLYNQIGGTFTNRLTFNNQGGFTNQSGGTFNNGAALYNTGSFENSAVFDNTGGTITGGGYIMLDENSSNYGLPYDEIEIEFPGKGYIYLWDPYTAEFILATLYNTTKKTYFANLDTAMAAAASGDVIEMLSGNFDYSLWYNGEYLAETVTIPSGVTLNIAGGNFIFSNDYLDITLVNYGVINITHGSLDIGSIGSFYRSASLENFGQIIVSSSDRYDGFFVLETGCGINKASGTVQVDCFYLDRGEFYNYGIFTYDLADGDAGEIYFSLLDSLYVNEAEGDFNFIDGIFWAFNSGTNSRLINYGAFTVESWTSNVYSGFQLEGDGNGSVGFGSGVTFTNTNWDVSNFYDENGVVISDPADLAGKTFGWDESGVGGWKEGFGLLGVSGLALMLNLDLELEDEPGIDSDEPSDPEDVGEPEEPYDTEEID